MKVALIGGHITPAVALMELLVEKQDEIVFIGHKGSTAERHIAREKTLAEEFGASYFEIQPVKIDRYQLIRSLFELPRLLGSVQQASAILRKTNPDVVVGFGGYLSMAVGIAARVLSIPMVLHEQTTRAGLANRLLSKTARFVAVSYQSSQNFFPKHKVRLTGNLIRKAFFTSAPTPTWWKKTNKHLVYVTGGSQGSLVLNQVLKDSLPVLLQEYLVVHQYGNQTPLLPQDSKQENYIGKSWLTDDEAAFLMQQASCVVSRAGANTVSEIMVSGVPAVLVPLQGTQQNEQFFNAKLVADEKAGIILDQKTVDPTILCEAVSSIVSDKSYSRAARSLSSSINQDAVGDFYELLSS